MLTIADEGGKVIADHCWRNMWTAPYIFGEPQFLIKRMLLWHPVALDSNLESSEKVAADQQLAQYVFLSQLIIVRSFNIAVEYKS